MYKLFLIFLFLICAVIFFPASADAQVAPENPFGRQREREEEPLPKNIQENLKKGEIRQLKKDYEEMLENGKEALKLSEEIETSYNKNNQLNSTDIQKLDKIEKLLKKVRRELGGDDDSNETEEKKPSSIKNAVESLKDLSTNLYEELKKTSRFSISVVAIQSSNSILDVVRAIRFWKK